MIKGLIFDLDGTLIDSIADITTSANLAIEQFGYEPKSKDFVRLNTGKGFRVLIKDMLPSNVDDKTIDAITDYYTKMYAIHYMDETSPYEGINELLEKLQEDNIKIAVNSNKKNEYTVNLMKKIFPKINFIATIGERPGIKNKPDPTTTYEIIEMMKLTKNEVCYVGDSEVDMKTGINAGLKTIGCLWGFRGKEILTKYNPTIMVRKPMQIYEYIKRS